MKRFEHMKKSIVNDDNMRVIGKYRNYAIRIVIYIAAEWYDTATEQPDTST